jgi:hypothetical protein
MKRLIILTSLAFAILLSSCQHDDANSIVTEETSEVKYENDFESILQNLVLIKKRQTDAVISLKDVSTKENSKQAAIIQKAVGLGEFDKLGYGFKLNNEFPIENPSNITFPVLDVYKIDADYNDQISINKLYTTDNNYSAFTTSSNYFKIAPLI